MRISSRVHLVGGGTFGLSHPTDCNIYAIDCGSSTVLVDAGSGIDAERVLRNVEVENMPPVSHIALTHSHWDHARGAARLAREWDATIVASPGATRELAETRWASTYVGSLIDSVPEPVDRALYVERDQTLAVGDLELTVIATPGHTDDSLSYLLAGVDGGGLFTGDTVLGGGSLGTSDLQTDLGAVFDSATLLSALRAACLFPGHGAFTLEAGWVQVELLVEALSGKWGVVPGRQPLLPTWWLQRHPELLESERGAVTPRRSDSQMRSVSP